MGDWCLFLPYVRYNPYVVMGIRYSWIFLTTTSSLPLLLEDEIYQQM